MGHLASPFSHAIASQSKGKPGWEFPVRRSLTKQPPFTTLPQQIASVPANVTNNGSNAPWPTLSFGSQQLLKIGGSNEEFDLAIDPLFSAVSQRVSLRRAESGGAPSAAAAAVRAAHI